MFRTVRFWVGAAISAILIALFFRATHPREMGDAFAEADYLYMAPAVGVLFLALWLRCYRWSLLMRPVAVIAPRRLFSYAIIGYMANNLIPARAGEIVRAYVLGDREHVSKVGTLGTIAVERLFDGVVLVLMLLTAGAIVGLGDGKLQIIAAASTALFVVAFAAFYWVTASVDRAHRLVHAVTSRLPGRLGELTEHIAEPLVNGLRSVHDWRTFGAVLALSAAAWTVEAGAYAVIGRGFGIDVNFAHFALLLAAANLAIIVPTFFGGTGPFEWAAKLVLVGAGIPQGLAAAYAIVAHAVIFIPTTIVGLILLWTFGISFGRLSEMDVPVDEKPAVVP